MAKKKQKTSRRRSAGGAIKDLAPLAMAGALFKVLESKLQFSGSNILLPLGAALLGRQVGVPMLANVGAMKLGENFANMVLPGSVQGFAGSSDLDQIEMEISRVSGDDDDRPRNFLGRREDEL